MRNRWWLVSDIDGTLTGDVAALTELAGLLQRSRDRLGFGVASGRSPELVDEAVREFSLPDPEIVIASVGSELRGPGLTGCDWPVHTGWDREQVTRLLSGLPGLKLQEAAGQGRYKVSFETDGAGAERARRALAAEGLDHSVIASAGRFLDVLPAGTDKGSALVHVMQCLGVPLQQVVTAGDSGNDRDLLTCGARAIMVANHTDELADLAGHPLVFRARRPYAGGILEGLAHWGAPADWRQA